MKKTKVTIEISSCKQCPFFRESSDYSLDGWDRGTDWSCGAKENKPIATFVEWHEAKKIEIPEWCPARTEPAN